MKRAAAIILAAGLLAGCSAGASPTSTPDPSVAREAAFLKYFHDGGSKARDKDLLVVGYGVCKALQSGEITEGDTLVYAMKKYPAYGTAVDAGFKATLLCPDWFKA